MNEQSLDLRRAFRIIRDHWILVLVTLVIGLAAGAGYSFWRPPLQSSQAQVVLANSSGNTGSIMATQALIAGSDSVLAGALCGQHSAGGAGHPCLNAPFTLVNLRKLVQVSGVQGSQVISITGSAKTATQARDIANAVAASYINYVKTHNSPKKLTAGIMQPAAYATGKSLTSAMILTGIVGGFVGLLVGAIIALARGRGSRRLRLRDELADAIGVPVVASIAVSRPNSARAWSALLEKYEPSAEHAWRLRSALRYLGLPDVMASRPSSLAVGRSITILSLASDRKALSLGPQLAVFAASRGLNVVLVVGMQPDAKVAKATEALRAVCAAPASSSNRLENLEVIAASEATRQLPEGGLVIVVEVVDGAQPSLEGAFPTTATVLGVSAGSCTADELARVAACAASTGGQIDGILLADPDSSDPTTGRMPQMARSDHRLRPTRVTGLPMESRRRTGDFGS